MPQWQAFWGQLLANNYSGHRKVLSDGELRPHSKIGNCNIDFFNFRHCQVWNLEILDLFEQNWNFAVIFWKCQKQNWKSTMYIATVWMQSIITLKLHEISLVSWNIIKYSKISWFLVKFSKSLKDLRKILLNNLENSQIVWTFFHALKNVWKLCNFYP